MSTPMEPRIGVMASGKHYAYLHGYDQEPVVGTRESLEQLLQEPSHPEPSEPEQAPSQATEAHPELADPKAAASAKRGQAARRVLKTYVVSVEPTVVAYAGSWCGGAYELEVMATSRDEALKQARDQRRKNEGRLAPSARYTARLKAL